MHYPRTAARLSTTLNCYLYAGEGLQTFNGIGSTMVGKSRNATAYSYSYEVTQSLYRKGTNWLVILSKM